MAQMHNVALPGAATDGARKGTGRCAAIRITATWATNRCRSLKFPDTVVAVCEKRSEGIRRIRAEHPEVDLIVMDDGFQHRYVGAEASTYRDDRRHASRPARPDAAAGYAGACATARAENL